MVHWGSQNKRAARTARPADTPSAAIFISTPPSLGPPWSPSRNLKFKPNSANRKFVERSDKPWYEPLSFCNETASDAAGHWSTSALCILTKQGYDVYHFAEPPFSKWYLKHVAPRFWMNTKHFHKESLSLWVTFGWLSHLHHIQQWFALRTLEDAALLVLQTNGDEHTGNYEWCGSPESSDQTRALLDPISGECLPKCCPATQAWAWDPCLPSPWSNELTERWILTSMHVIENVQIR